LDEWYGRGGRKLLSTVARWPKIRGQTTQNRPPKNCPLEKKISDRKKNHKIWPKMAEKYSILFLFSIRGDYITFI
jgi:hypothetical protein